MLLCFYKLHSIVLSKEDSLFVPKMERKKNIHKIIRGGGKNHVSALFDFNLLSFILLNNNGKLNVRRNQKTSLYILYATFCDIIVCVFVVQPNGILITTDNKLYFNKYSTQYDISMLYVIFIYLFI